jgi:hypothetical protein
VNIPGEQREPLSSTCPNCGSETDTISKAEKGIDSSLIVHLFDTAAYWDVAYLVSGDADFVPAVRSLRRQGKLINVVGFGSSVSSALLKECFEFIDLTDFFRQDVSAYRLLDNPGLIAKLLCNCFADVPIRLPNGTVVTSPVRSLARIGCFPSGVSIVVESRAADYSKAAKEFDKIQVDGNRIGERREFLFGLPFYDFLLAKFENLAKRMDLPVSSFTDNFGIQHSFYTEVTWDDLTKSYKP